MPSTGRAASRPLLRLYRKLPGGIELTQSAAEVSDALAGLAGQVAGAGVDRGGRPRLVHAHAHGRRAQPQPPPRPPGRPAARAWRSRPVPEKRYYMACLDLEGRDVLVVGGGPVALEKVDGLLDCGAQRDRRRPADRPRARSPRCRARTTRAIAPRTSTGASSSSPRPRRARSTAASFATPRRGRCSATSSTCPSCAASSSPRCTASTRSQSPSRPGAPPPRSRSASATTWRRSSRPEHAELARQLRDVRPWAKSHYPTYQARRAFFQQLVEERLG